jgi:hypothetical protein
MDRSYIDFERLFRLSDAGSFFVTRAKSNLKVQRRYSRKVDKSTGLICDQTVVLTDEKEEISFLFIAFGCLSLRRMRNGSRHGGRYTESRESRKKEQFPNRARLLMQNL